MKRRDFITAVPLALLLGTGIVACEDSEGPAEKAGEKIDETMEEAGDKMEDAADTVEDKTDQ
jgi:hypothetical protein